MIQYKFVVDKEPDYHLNVLEKATQVDIFQDPNWLKVSAQKGWRRSLFFTVFDGDNPVISAQAYINSSKLFGEYLYILHGPIFAATTIDSTSENLASEWGQQNFMEQESTRTKLEFFIDELVEFAKRSKIFAIIIEPLASKESIIGKLIEEKKFQPQRRVILPKYPMFIDLNKSEEQLLAGINKKTRYNIRYAERNGIEIKVQYPSSEKPNLKIVEDYLNLQSEVSVHKGYKIPSKGFFTSAWETYVDTNNVAIIGAYFEGKLISANFTQFYKNWAGSYYTANSHKYPKLRASYLLKWRTILEAKNNGMKIFDMWGLIPGLPESHPEYGYGQFKLSFNPIQKEFVGRTILPIHNNRYRLWKLLGDLNYQLRR